MSLFQVHFILGSYNLFYRNNVLLSCQLPFQKPSGDPACIWDAAMNPLTGFKGPLNLNPGVLFKLTY